jgi:hypothetical protein
MGVQIDAQTKLLPLRPPFCSAPKKYVLPPAPREVECATGSQYIKGQLVRSRAILLFRVNYF